MGSDDEAQQSGMYHFGTFSSYLPLTKFDLSVNIAIVIIS
jgi:hypothetical protein